MYNHQTVYHGERLPIKTSFHSVYTPQFQEIQQEINPIGQYGTDAASAGDLEEVY